MLKYTRGKLRAYFKNAEKKSEEEKMRVIWIWTILFMIGIFGVWVINASRNLASLGQKGAEISGLPDFPKPEDIDINGTLQEGSEMINEYSEQSKAQWGKIGDAYIAEKNIFANDSFSILKLKDVKLEDSAIVLNYEHYYKNILVLDSRLVLAVDSKSKEVSERENTLKKGIDLSADPVVSAKEAADIAAKEINGSEYSFKEAVLAIAQEEDKYYLVWQTVFQKGDAVSDIRKILVGAKRGGILSVDPISGEQASANQLKSVTE